MQQQPVLAPAPHGHVQSQETTTEQTLRAHLLPHLGNTQPAPAPASTASQDTKPVVSAGQDMNIDPAISGGAGTTHQAQPISQPSTQPQVAPAQHPPPPASHPIQQMNLSPAVTPAVPTERSQSHSGTEDTAAEQPKPRGGKRELSTSKRAAQNRAAQRAFRQRKEGYIKKLEEQVRDFTNMQETFKQIQQENLQLRSYIISLQGRFIETHGADALPPPPPAIALHPHPPPLTPFDNQSTVASATPAAQAAAHPTVQNQPAAAPTTIANEAPASTAAIGQKRPHEDNDGAFLQSIAQAAGTTNPAPAPVAPQGNGFVATNHPQVQVTAAVVSPTTTKTARQKSSSPTTKRIRGESSTAPAEETKADVATA